MNNNQNPSPGNRNPQGRNPNGQYRQPNQGQYQRPPQNQNGYYPPQNPQGYQNAQGRPNPQNPQAQRVQNPQAQRVQNPQAQPYQNAPKRVKPKKTKVKLTPEQIEQDKIRRQREKHHIRKARAAKFRIFLARLIVYILLTALIATLVGGAFYMYLNARDPEDVSGYSYKIGADARSYTLGYTDAVRDGRVYICFSDIAELCDMAAVGSLDDMKYVVKGDDAETIRFVTGTHTVYVNEVEARLPSESYLKGDKLYVPLDFVTSYCKGLTVEINRGSHRITVTRDEIVELDAAGNPIKTDDPVYEGLSFLLASPAPMANIDEDAAKAIIPMPDMGFTMNLSPYEDYMNPGNTSEFLTLVNVKNPLDAAYVPQDLIGVEGTRDDGRDEQMLRQYAAKALEALFIEMDALGMNPEDEKTGLKVSVTSGYRSYGLQDYLFKQRLQQYSYLGDGAYAAASAIVNPPGSSEHQTGLCFDMHNLASADIAFGKTEQFKWLRDNSWKFGFILRYPEDKVDVTGISYEPWHYRYVGRYHAQRMYEMDMCLEEYCAYLGLVKE